MTQNEAAAIFANLFVAFPHMGDYVDKTPDPQATINEWKAMLGSVNHDAAKTAVARWKSGEAEVPDKPWELSLLPLKLRAVAGKIADERAKAERQRSIQAESDARLSAVKRSNCGALVRLSLVAGGMRRDGLLTDERNQEIVRELKSQVGRDDQEVRVPPEIAEYMRSSGVRHART
jgi:hypothetical protein